MFVLGIFTQRSHAAGVITGALASAAVMFAVSVLWPVHAFVYPIIGIATGLVVGYSASLLVPRNNTRYTGTPAARITRP